jgi:hypothetical protein
MSHAHDSKHDVKPSAPNPETPHRFDGGSDAFAISRRQLVFGWWALLGYLTIGIALEGLHGFKVGFYLDAANETRQLLWRLAHAHGTLLSLINIAFGLTLRVAGEPPKAPAPGSVALASRCLIGAAIVLPVGFFAGGVFIFAGDPGLPILLVPLGAVLLFLGVLLAARTAASIPAATRPAARKDHKPSDRGRD